MATIKMVAEEAGVSTATVSRVLNGNYPVSKDAYEHVMAAVEKLNYRTNNLAKSLKMNKTFMIGLVVPDISNSFFMELARGIEDIVTERGYTLTVCSTDEDNDKEIRLLKALNDKRVDLVVLASSLKDKEPLEDLRKRGLRLVMVDTYIAGLKSDYILEDNESSSFELVDYALGLGHKKVGIINGILTVSTARERFEGFRRALKKHKISLNESYVVSGAYNRKKACKEVKDMLTRQMNNLPTLLYATNNEMTEGALMAIKELGLRVPEDISVISYGEISLPELVEPRLTIIHQKPREIGEMAGQILIQRLDDENYQGKPTPHIVQGSLVIRDSVKEI